MKSKLALSLLACGLVFTGCAKKEEAAAATSAPAAAVAANGVLTVEITANDMMKFSVTKIDAKPGQEIKVILTNIGSMPKAAMGHNWVLLTKGADMKAFVNAAVGAAATDYIPAALASQVVAHTKLLGPKQSDEITFKAPTEPGDYDFVCSFPAHYLSGMHGVLTVK